FENYVQNSDFFASDNLVFGSGGGLLQKFDRDTMKFAIKCSYVYIEGRGGVSVAKDPVTDRGKRNKPGRLKLIKDKNQKYVTVSSINDKDIYDDKNVNDELVTVFENGKILKEYTFDEIRKNCEIDLDQVDGMTTL
ncbi:unnamed protein product, partial [Didymodactylos carnosus]